MSKDETLSSPIFYFRMEIGQLRKRKRKECGRALNTVSEKNEKASRSHLGSAPIPF